MYLVEKHVLQLATPVTERVYDRIMKCVACNLLAPRRMEELFRPQPVYPHSVGQIIAHIGLMLHQVNLTFSPTSWQQVKTCAEACVKFQLLSASYDPARHDNVLRVTKNHIDGICHMAGNQGKAKECASAIVQRSGHFTRRPACHNQNVLHCAQLLQRRFVSVAKAQCRCLSERASW